MAISAATVWRIRPGGDDTNGAAYDATISGAGTDYSQQDAAQLSLTDLICQASDDASRLKLRSATGGFTSAMIGNAIRILKSAHLNMSGLNTRSENFLTATSPFTK
jgi:hypothetical protein